MANPNPDPTHQFKKGQSGNPLGKAKMPPELRDMAKGASIEAMQRAIEFVRDKKADPNVVLKAIQIVLERAYGKPAQPHDGDGQGGPVKMSVTVKFIKPPTTKE